MYKAFVYKLTHSASKLSGFTCTSSLTMNEKFIGEMYSQWEGWVSGVVIYL